MSDCIDPRLIALLIDRLRPLIEVNYARDESRHTLAESLEGPLGQHVDEETRQAVIESERSGHSHEAIRILVEHLVRREDKECLWVPAFLATLKKHDLKSEVTLMTQLATSNCSAEAWDYVVRNFQAILKSDVREDTLVTLRERSNATLDAGGDGVELNTQCLVLYTILTHGLEHPLVQQLREDLHLDSPQQQHGLTDGDTSRTVDAQQATTHCGNEQNEDDHDDDDDLPGEIRDYKKETLFTMSEELSFFEEKEKVICYYDEKDQLFDKLGKIDYEKDFLRDHGEKDRKALYDKEDEDDDWKEDKTCGKDYKVEYNFFKPKLVKNAHLNVQDACNSDGPTLDDHSFFIYPAANRSQYKKVFIEENTVKASTQHITILTFTMLLRFLMNKFFKEELRDGIDSLVEKVSCVILDELKHHSTDECVYPVTRDGASAERPPATESTSAPPTYPHYTTAATQTSANLTTVATQTSANLTTSEPPTYPNHATSATQTYPHHATSATPTYPHPITAAPQTSADTTIHAHLKTIKTVNTTVKTRSVSGVMGESNEEFHSSISGSDHSSSGCSDSEETQLKQLAGLSSSPSVSGVDHSSQNRIDSHETPLKQTVDSSPRHPAATDDRCSEELETGNESLHESNSSDSDCSSVNPQKNPQSPGQKFRAQVRNSSNSRIVPDPIMNTNPAFPLELDETRLQYPNERLAQPSLTQPNSGNVQQLGPVRTRENRPNLDLESMCRGCNEVKVLKFCEDCGDRHTHRAY